jgi:hypothetical protein
MKRFVAVATVLFIARPAQALDCPPGSTARSHDGYDWCEPSICENDSQCMPNVCRPVALCIQVGALTSDAAALSGAGKRLVATQRCAPDKSCPQTTVCSEKGRCVSKVDAERMLSLKPAASAAPGPATETKSKCGCEAVGVATGAQGGIAAAALAVVTWRRARARKRGSRPQSR